MGRESRLKVGQVLALAGADALHEMSPDSKYLLVLKRGALPLNGILRLREIFVEAGLKVAVIVVDGDVNSTVGLFELDREAA